MDFKAVIFDLDGTLLDTLEDIADAMNSVLGKHGCPLHETDAYRHFVGDGVYRLVERVLPEVKRDDETVAEFVEAYREAYGKNWNSKTRPYAGIPEMLEDLAARRLKLAVLSNKPDEFANRCVNEFLSRWSFHKVLGYREEIPQKPDPAGAFKIAESLHIQPGKILYLGDTSVDMKTAVAAGMYPVGALWGFRSFEELLGAGARKLIEKPQELLTLFSDT